MSDRHVHRHGDWHRVLRCLGSGLEHRAGLDRRLRRIRAWRCRSLGRLWLGRCRRRRRGDVDRCWWNQLDRRWRSRARRRWGRGGCARWQQCERVDIALRIARDADTQVDVRDVVLGRPARPDRPYRCSFADSVALCDRERTEMNEGHRVAVVGLDRDDLSVRADRPGERDDARSRREHDAGLLALDVDAAMLAAGVRVAADDEGREHVSRSRPRPRVRGGRQHGHGEGGDNYCERPHRSSFVSETGNASTVAGAADVVNFEYRSRRASSSERAPVEPAARDRRQT